MTNGGILKESGENMRKFKILTELSVEKVLEMEEELQEQGFADLIKQQDDIIGSYDGYYAVHFMEDEHFTKEEYDVYNYLYDAIQILAIKDGYDLVEFENGNMGYVAYYNGHENMFEFKEITEKEYCLLGEDEHSDSSIQKLLMNSEEIESEGLLCNGENGK